MPMSRLNSPLSKTVFTYPVRPLHFANLLANRQRSFAVINWLTVLACAQRKASRWCARDMASHDDSIEAHAFDNHTPSAGSMTVMRRLRRSTMNTPAIVRNEPKTIIGVNGSPRSTTPASTPIAGPGNNTEATSETL